MSFGESIKTCFSKYATFSGRARRSEYWWFSLFDSLVSLALQVLPVIGWIVAVILLLPGLAVTVRRLHDVDKSGWWVLINLIPLVGTIVMLVFCCTDTKPGPNRFGDAPK